MVRTRYSKFPPIPTTLKLIRKMYPKISKKSESFTLYFDKTLDTWPVLEYEKDLNWVYSVCYCWKRVSENLCNLFDEDKNLSVENFPQVVRDRYRFAGQVFMRACELRGISSTPINRFYDKLNDLSTASRDIQLLNLRRYLTLIDDIFARLEIKLELEADGLVPKTLEKRPSVFSRPSELEKKIIRVYLSEPRRSFTAKRLAEEVGRKNTAHFRAKLAYLVTIIF